MNEIAATTLTKTPFEMIGKDWMLVTAQYNGKVNTMTASWGGLGVMWGKDVAFLVIRPQRYTKEFIDQSTQLSLSFFGQDYHKELGYLGSVSGRDENKIEKAGLTIVTENSVPYFAEADTVLLCKKLFAQPFEESAFLDTSILEKWYPDKDYHTLYIAEIEKVLKK